MERERSLIRDNETKLECGVRVGVCALICLFVFLAILGNLFTKHSGIFYFSTAVICAAVGLWLIAAFSQKTANAYNTWLVFIFIAAFVSRLIMLSTWPIEPSSDFKDTYEAALALADADLSEVSTIMKNNFEFYYTTWSVHMPFILLERAIIKVFGKGYYPIQIFFNIFSALSCVITASIAKSLYGRRAGIIAGIVMAFLPLSLMYSAVLSNQHMATFFFLLAMYILIERPMGHRLVNVALASLSTVVSQLIRPEMPVFLIAVVCYFVYKYILGVRNMRKLKAAQKKLAGYLVMFLGIYVALTFLTGLMMNEAGFIANKTTQSNYKYKIATGLDAQSGGQWTEFDASCVDDEAMLDKLISERTEDKIGVAVLAVKKIMYQYGTYNYPWCIEGKSGDFVDKWYEPLTNAVMLVILLLCLFKIIMSIFNKSRRELLPLIALLGYFMVFMLLEVQNRYNYLAIPLFVIFASGALIHIYGNEQAFIEKIKDKHIKSIEK